MTGNPNEAPGSCPGCGAHRPAGAVFCPVCGRAVSSTPSPAWAAPAAPDPTAAFPAPGLADTRSPSQGQPPAPPPSWGASSAPEPPARLGTPPGRARRSRVPVVAALGIVGLVVVLGAGAVLLGAPGGTHATPTPALAAASLTASPTAAQASTPTPIPTATPAPTPAPTPTATPASPTAATPFTASMASSRGSQTATVLYDGRVLIAGGYDGSNYLDSAEVYDPTAGTFTPTGSMTTARASQTATALSDGRVLIAGGSDASAELYDPTTGSFTRTGSMMTARASHTATALFGGRVLIAGGENGSTRLASAEVYNPTTGAFPTRPLTERELKAACNGTRIPRAAKYAGTVHPLVVVFGGAVSADDFAINAKWGSGTWPGEIQLIVCVGPQKHVNLGSCGTYIRKSDGRVGQVIRYRHAQVVRVVVARTGKTLQSKTFYGSTPTCAKSLPDPGTSPPWRFYGNNVSDNAINKYATSVSRQKVK